MGLRVASRPPSPHATLSVGGESATATLVIHSARSYRRVDDDDQQLEAGGGGEQAPRSVISDNSRHFVSYLAVLIRVI